MGVSARAGTTLRAIGVAVLIAGAASAATDENRDLRRYAVTLVKAPGTTWRGNGVYLGQGLVLTAVHVVPRPHEAGPIIVVAGRQLQGTVIKYGDFESVDLAIVKIDETELPYNIRHLPFLSVCSSDPEIGQRVVVATADNIAPSHIVSADRFAPNIAHRFRSLIADVDTTGNSGSGIFDAASECLLGIMSRKVEEFTVYRQNGIETRRPKLRAKYFIPASSIREFAAPWLGTRYLRR